jgi:hypothetical protein
MHFHNILNTFNSQGSLAGRTAKTAMAGAHVMEFSVPFVWWRKP